MMNRKSWRICLYEKTIDVNIYMLEILMVQSLNLSAALYVEFFFPSFL
jgi:hypothetical protein